MGRKRRTFSSEQKFMIVLEAIKGQRQISEIASEFSVHPNQITNWKKQFLEQGADIFNKRPDTTVDDMKRKESVLMEKIGKQSVELDFLRDCQKKLESWRNENS